MGFLFLAGSGFIIAANRKADDYKNFRKPLWDYLRRLGFDFTFGLRTSFTCSFIFPII